MEVLGFLFEDSRFWKDKTLCGKDETRKGADKMENNFFDDLGDTLSRTAKEFGERAESFYSKQKLRGQISMEERAADKALLEIGNAIYSRYAKGDEFDVRINGLCKRVDQYYQKIEELKNEIAGMDRKKICPACGKVIDRDAQFCSACGMAYPQEEDAEVVDGEIIDDEEDNGADLEEEDLEEADPEENESEEVTESEESASEEGKAPETTAAEDEEEREDPEPEDAEDSANAGENDQKVSDDTQEEE
jgi:RNA polymerase subunit RPABC4/transcription elongation factor Spt4